MKSQNSRRNNARSRLGRWAAALLVLGLAGCAATPVNLPGPSGFLTGYNQLHKVDETTSRFVDASRLRNCRRFTIPPVLVNVKSLKGEPLQEQGGMAADYVKMALIKALSDRYPITDNPGPDVGVLRIAITGAAIQGTQLALTVEGEVLTSPANEQAAALLKTQVSREHDENWSYRLTFRQMATAWAADFRRLLDETQAAGTEPASGRPVPATDGVRR